MTDHMHRLITAAATETPSAVETALGRFRDETRVAAAREAAAAALGASRWDNLSYLAGFLADVTAPHPPTGGDGSEGEDEEGGRENTPTGAIDITRFVTARGGE